MNKEQTEAAIKVMQAYVDGEEIEVKDGYGWFDSRKPSWNWVAFDYRIKPKPVEFKVWYRDSDGSDVAYCESDITSWYADRGYRLITVREVV